MLRQDRGRRNYSSNVDISTNLRHIHACCKTFADGAAADRSQLANTADSKLDVADPDTNDKTTSKKLVNITIALCS